MKRVPKKDSDLKLSEKERAHLDGITAFIETIPEELPPSPERPKQEKPKATPPPKVISKPESFAIPAQNIPSTEASSPSSPDTFSDKELIRLLALRKRYVTGAFNEKTTEAKRLEVTRWEYQHHKLNEGFPTKRKNARDSIEQPREISLLEVTKKPNYVRPEPKPAQKTEKPSTLTAQQQNQLEHFDEIIGKTPEEIPIFSWKPRNDRFTSKPMLLPRRRRRGRPSSGKAMSHTLEE